MGWDREFYNLAKSYPKLTGNAVPLIAEAQYNVKQFSTTLTIFAL